MKPSQKWSWGFRNSLLNGSLSSYISRNSRPLLLVMLLFPIFSSCKHDAAPAQYNKLAAEPNLFHASSKQLTDVIVHDIFKPPVASRIYTYSYLAAYETMRQQHPEYKSMAGTLNEFTPVPKPEKGVEYCFPLAGVVAFNTVGEELTFSKNLWDDFNKTFYAKYKEMGIPEDVYQRSVAYGQKVAKHVLDYAGGDKYKQTRSMRYTIVNSPGLWVPTPPTYADACEPVWNTTRPFLLDSCSQFRPAPCAPFDLNPHSAYYKVLREVYDINKHLTDEQRKIAYFWDDNAFVTHVSGHAMYATKKMTPPGHWFAILRTVAKKKKLDMMKSAQAYLITSLVMHDGFVAAWDEKYRSRRVRPVTVIQAEIDQEWMPLLETPAFPEYVSAHSAISAAAGTVLTKLIGDNIAFTDSTEHEYGFGVRSFSSFRQAYNETNISRVYGGIHYRDGASAGMKLGEKLGAWAIQKLQLDSTRFLAGNTHK